MVGLQDLHRDKAEFDRHLLGRNFEAISYYAFELGSVDIYLSHK